MRMRTESQAYAARLVNLQQAWWKRVLDVQAPYRIHLRRLRLGRTLEIGCGIGRNLIALGTNGVGIDHNVAAVEVARRRGLRAFTPAEFRTAGEARCGSFDAMLVAHVAEHMREEAVVHLLREYLPLVRLRGRLVVITPQELGFRSDPTHVEFMDFARVASVVRAVGLTLERQYSFPLPRRCGRYFRYNEFVTIACKGETEERDAK
jgi:SAM-dependent methyltransferase